jgi:hypothetical protein
MKNKELLDLIRDKFYARLERKTGWGKEELKLEYEKAITEALTDILNKQGEYK